MADPQTPTVNSQITDAVTQTNVTVVGEAPAQSMAMVYQSMAHATSLLMQNSVMAQGGMQQINSAVVASACQRIMTLPSQKTAAPQSPPVSFNLNQPPSQTTEQPNGEQLGGETSPAPSPDEQLAGRSVGPQLTPDKKRSVILKAANEAAKVAALASEASNDYNETQEMAEDMLAAADPNDSQSMEDAKSASATAHDAARCAKMASQASQRADVLYAQIFDTANGPSPSLDTIRSLFKQLTGQTSKAEKARDKVKEYKNQVNGLSGLDI
ncbi:MAG: RebB family R body protein [Crocosphaera sp.]|nr:RebB family R body protein [Crocosphaera sp.]